jgi:glycerophosphoryl diester phosphodiesterase
MAIRIRVVGRMAPPGLRRGVEGITQPRRGTIDGHIAVIGGCEGLAMPCPRLRHAVLASTGIGLALVVGCAPMPAPIPTTDSAAAAPSGRGGGDLAARVLVVAHRGASGYRPEHTLAAYELAIAQGADFIEPDLVPTKDGVLIARHENELSATTDVADRPEFAHRRTVKTIDGVRVEGWFSEDFTLAEIRTLRARTPWPTLRPEAAAENDRHPIPTFAEVLALARRHPGVGVYPETKHPTYFERTGTRLDGTPIATDVTRRLVDTLVAEGFTDPGRVVIQSFEVGNLVRLRRELLPAAGLDLPLVQLLGNTDPARARPGDGFSAPFDLADPTLDPATLDARYPGLAGALGRSPVGIGYDALATPAALAWMRRTYADGIGPWIPNLVPRVPIPNVPADANQPRARLTGAITPLLADARAAALAVHPYTLRAEPAFLALDGVGEVQSVEAAAIQLLALGATGYFIDHPDRGVAARTAWLARDR